MGRPKGSSTLTNVYALEYIHGDNNTTLETVAKKFNKSYSHMMALSAKQHWVESREAFRAGHGFTPHDGKLAKKSRERARDWEYLASKLMEKAMKLTDEKNINGTFFLDDVEKLIRSLEKCYNNIRKEDNVDTKSSKDKGQGDFPPINQFNQFNSAFKLTADDENTRQIPVEGNKIEG